MNIGDKIIGAEWTNETLARVMEDSASEVDAQLVPILGGIYREIACRLRACECQPVA